jgi:RND family efflux transporter MFP subunit
MTLRTPSTPFAGPFALPLALALSLSLAACGRSREVAQPAEPSPITARLAVAERVTADERTGFAGTVAAERSTAVSSRVMAMVTAVHVDLGDTVAAGQPLLSIDPTAAQGQVSQAQGGLAQAEAALTLAKRNLERFEALAATQSASALELDMARMQHDQAAGAVKQARGAVEAASSVARESRVVAPFAGRVAARLVEVGDLAAPGRPLVMIESSVGRRLIVAVPETVAGTAALAAGSTVTVTIDARPDLGEIAGRLAELSPGPDPVSHSYTAKIDLPAVDLPAGAAGRAYLATGRRDTVRVPRAALIESGGLTLVVVRDEAGRAQSRVVRTGAVSGSPGAAADAAAPVEILSGLAGGESVALGLAVAPPAGTRIDPIAPTQDAQP